MKFTITLEKLLTCLRALSEISGEKMKPMLAWKLATLRLQTKDYVEAFQEAHQIILDKYKQEEDGREIIPRPTISQYTKEVEEITSKEVTIEMEPILISDLPDVSPDFLYEFAWLLKEDNNKEDK